MRKIATQVKRLVRVWLVILDMPIGKNVLKKVDAACMVEPPTGRCRTLARGRLFIMQAPLKLKAMRSSKHLTPSPPSDSEQQRLRREGEEARAQGGR